MPSQPGSFKKKPGYKELGGWGWNDTKLWSKIQKNEDPRRCWSWTGSVHPAAALFGAWKIYDNESQQQMTQARRLIWQSIHNEDVGAYRVMHTCGNPHCVNPSHFELHETNRPDKQL
jgi:hypothetical protein